MDHIEIKLSNILYMSSDNLRETSKEKEICSPKSFSPPVAKTVKIPPPVQDTRVLSLGWEDPLEKGMTTNYSILA